MILLQHRRDLCQSLIDIDLTSLLLDHTTQTFHLQNRLLQERKLFLLLGHRCALRSSENCPATLHETHASATAPLDLNNNRLPTHPSCIQPDTETDKVLSLALCLRLLPIEFCLDGQLSQRIGNPCRNFSGFGIVNFTVSALQGEILWDHFQVFSGDNPALRDRHFLVPFVPHLERILPLDGTRTRDSNRRRTDIPTRLFQFRQRALDRSWRRRYRHGPHGWFVRH
mmetsp:Transcript_11964/g.27688  ORF Transcript_11964/g.27688 Transcript_11964/m.27688 type:complete len:226 (+) Transcript_11964:1204-1881(+)